jgi:hypothetical protein
MTIFDIASIVFFLAVIGFFVRPLFDGLIPTGKRPAPSPSPRSVSESGGYHAPAPRPRARAPQQATPDEYRTDLEDVESRPARPARAAARPATAAATGRAERLRGRMHERSAVQEAFILKELLDPPVGMRDQAPR